MGKIGTTGIDEADRIVSGSLTATGSSGAAIIGGLGPNAGGACPNSFSGLFNIALSGTFVATMQPQKSYDGGTTYIPLCTDSLGTAAVYTAPITIPVLEAEAGVLYRWTCTAYTSGTVNYRISQ